MYLSWRRIFAAKLTTLCLIRHHHVNLLCFLHQFPIHNQSSFVCLTAWLEKISIGVISKTKFTEMRWNCNLRLGFLNKFTLYILKLINFRWTVIDNSYTPIMYQLIPLRLLQMRIFHQIKVQITALGHMVMITALEAVIIFQSFLA